MRNLFDVNMAEQLKARITHLEPNSQRLWGKMSPAQAMAHCAGALEWAVGDSLPPRAFLGRIVGRFVKPMLLGNDQPMRKGAPTTRNLVIADQRDLAIETQRVGGLVDRFCAAGPAGCTPHPHSFFGRMTPEEWAILMYKHLDHHLRQFGV